MSDKLERLHGALQVEMRAWLRKNMPEEFGPRAAEPGALDPEFFVEQTAMNMADAALAVVDCSLACRGLPR